MAEGKQSRFDLIINAVERVSGPFRRIEQAMDGVRDRTEKARQALGRFSKVTGLQRLSGSIGNVRDKLQGMVQQGQAGLERLGALAGRLSLLFGAAGGGAFALGTEAATAAAEASKFASMVGLSTGNWQEYAGAATMAGMEADELASLMLTLQERAVNAARGEKGDIEMLKLMGISAKNAKGELKNADTLLLELADRVKKMREAGEMGKAAGIMNQLGGEEGARLLDLLKNGREGLLAMRKEARELGLVLSDEALESALEYGSAINRVKATFRGLGLTLGTAFLPSLTKLLDKFQAWLQVQRDIMSAGFERWIDGLDLDAVWRSVENFFASLGRLGRMLQRAADLCGGWSNVLTALVVLISGKALLALGSLALAFGQLGMAMLTTPVGWFVAAVAAVAGAAYAIYKNWDGLVAYFRGLWEGVRKAFEQGWLQGVVQVLLNFNPARWVMDGLSELVATLTGLDLYSIGVRWIDGLLQGVKQGWQQLTGWFSKGLDSLAGIFKMGDEPDDAGGGATTFPMSDPLNMVPGAKSMMQLARSERVIRQENTVRIIAPEGMRLEGNGQGRGLDVRGDVAEAGVLNAGAI
ncbi:hypothetical protein [Desulfovibrio piger]|uniref:hypothetical protein n=1 Tax=Desulfovibrio piger TaxID=901 RepID=UPI002666074E|nr:hypothetical protein [Desulfovibrio piger]